MNAIPTIPRPTTTTVFRSEGCFGYLLLSFSSSLCPLAGSALAFMPGADVPQPDDIALAVSLCGPSVYIACLVICCFLCEGQPVWTTASRSQGSCIHHELLCTTSRSEGRVESTCRKIKGSNLACPDSAIVDSPHIAGPEVHLTRPTNHCLI